MEQRDRAVGCTAHLAAPAPEIFGDLARITAALQAMVPDLEGLLNWIEGRTR